MGKNKELFSIPEIQQMTQDFDKIKFFRDWEDYFAVIMITPNQVAIAYCRTDKILCHDRIIDDLCIKLKDVGEESIVSISLAYEKELWKTFYVKERKNDGNITNKMINVIEKIYYKLFDTNSNSDIMHDKIEEILNDIDYKPNTETSKCECKEIIGISIDEYLKKLDEKAIIDDSQDLDR